MNKNKFFVFTAAFVGLIVFMVTALSIVSRVQSGQNSVEALVGSAEVRTPSSQQALSNMAILKSIPLVREAEKPQFDESKNAADLLVLFSKFEDHNRNANGTLNRGTHAKGTCLDGTFTVFSRDEMRTQLNYGDELIARLKRGFFDGEGVRPASVRFANADGTGHVHNDAVPDVRGFSFSVQTPDSITDFRGEHRQDFMFNSTPQFATGGIREFTELVKIANVFTYGDLSMLPNPFATPDVVRDLGLIGKGNKASANLMSFATEVYWDNLPYTHGLTEDHVPLDLVKYKVVPCDGKGEQQLAGVAGLDPDYLQKDIVNRAHEGKICFLFQIQPLDLARLNAAYARTPQAHWTKSDWVENGGLLWPEDALPFYTVAKIEVPSNFAMPPSCDDKYINTRLHSNPLNQPVGSIARVRTIVEEASRARRMANQR